MYFIMTFDELIHTHSHFGRNKINGPNWRNWNIRSFSSAALISDHNIIARGWSQHSHNTILVFPPARSRVYCCCCCCCFHLPFHRRRRRRWFLFSSFLGYRAARLYAPWSDNSSFYCYSRSATCKCYSAYYTYTLPVVCCFFFGFISYMATPKYRSVFVRCFRMNGALRAARWFHTSSIYSMAAALWSSLSLALTLFGSVHLSHLETVCRARFACANGHSEKHLFQCTHKHQCFCLCICCEYTACLLEINSPFIGI